MAPLRPPLSCRQRQHGAVFLVMLVIMILGSITFLVNSLQKAALQNERDKITAEALAQAKEALIGYAASVTLTPSGSTRPGDLPCPDMNNDGVAELSCGNAWGTTGQSQRIGRLPWKTLGLPDLRDGTGERLWYAVSTNFKNNTRTPCSSPGQAGCLNSDTAGTITIYSSTGVLLNDGSGTTGAVAVIIAPGAPLIRQDGVTQDRSTTGLNTASNYLDIATINGLTEDNANFTDGSATKGFIQGRITDSNDNLIVNDQMLIISQDNIMQAVQKRVAGEMKQCLTEYASPANGGIHLYPWATPVNDLSYQDNSGTLLGRIPDTPFNDTQDDNGTMQNSWVGNCNINSNSGWWLNWKNLVFYGIASSYAPTGTATCGSCLTISPPGTGPTKQFSVIVAGKTLPGQNRPSNNLNDYLEAPNNSGTSLFAQSAPSATFNDTLTFQ